MSELVPSAAAIISLSPKLGGDEAACAALAVRGRAEMLGACARRLTYLDEVTGEAVEHIDFGELDSIHFAGANAWSVAEWKSGNVGGQFDRYNRFVAVDMHFSALAIQVWLDELPLLNDRVVRGRKGRPEEYDWSTLRLMAEEEFARTPRPSREKCADIICARYSETNARTPSVSTVRGRLTKWANTRQ